MSTELRDECDACKQKKPAVMYQLHASVYGGTNPGAALCGECIKAHKQGLVRNIDKARKEVKAELLTLYGKFVEACCIDRSDQCWVSRAKAEAKMKQSVKWPRHW